MADRFHLIMNLSEAIIREIKLRLPNYINILNKQENVLNKEPVIPKEGLTNKQKEKQRLILEIRAEADMGKSVRSLAKEYGLHRNTISKYININDVEQASIYNRSDRFYSYLDLYKEEIIELYLQTNNISEVYRRLKKKKIKLTYSTLRYYISKINSKSKNQETIKIKRSEIIRYIFNWKHKEKIDIWIPDILEEFPIIKTYKLFYQKFKEYLTSLNTLCFVNLLSSNYEDNCINKFIMSLKTDWEAVLNAASYGISNGITEDNVNKIKQIKRDMYGRASSELLRRKIIYQSIFS